MIKKHRSIIRNTTKEKRIKMMEIITIKAKRNEKETFEERRWKPRKSEIYKIPQYKVEETKKGEYRTKRWKWQQKSIINQNE